MLLDAARSCYRETGYRDVTIDDVCRAAKVSKGFFYGYFASKQALLLALLDEESGQLEELMDQLSSADLSSAARLRRFTQTVLDRGGDQASVQLRADLWAATLSDTEVRARFVAANERSRARLRGWIEEGIASGELVEVPANALAAILLALSDGLMLHGAVAPQAFRWARVEGALGVLLAGISATTTGRGD